MQHRMGHRQATLVVEDIWAWPCLLDSPGGLRIPDIIEPAISQLALYLDGLRCQLDPTGCWHICWDPRAMKEHR